MELLAVAMGVGVMRMIRKIAEGLGIGPPSRRVAAWGA